MTPDELEKIKTATAEQRFVVTRDAICQNAPDTWEKDKLKYYLRWIFNVVGDRGWEYCVPVDLLAEVKRSEARKESQ